MFVLIPHFGIEGAAAVRTAVQIGVAFSTLAWIGKALGHTADTRQNLRCFVLLVALTVGLALLISAGPEQAMSRLLVLFSLYCGFVFLIFWLVWKPSMLRELQNA